MKLEDIVLTPGPPPSTEVGMVVKLEPDNELAIIGNYLTAGDAPMNEANDGGCDCCCKHYKVLAWAWLPGFPLDK